MLTDLNRSLNAVSGANLLYMLGSPSECVPYAGGAFVEEDARRCENEEKEFKADPTCGRGRACCHWISGSQCGRLSLRVPAIL